MAVLLVPLVVPINLNVTRYSQKAVSRAKIDLTKQSVLEIDGILTEQIEKR